MFLPLRSTYPALYRLARVLHINGQTLDGMKDGVCNIEDVLRLEGLIGELCSSIHRPDSLEWHSEASFEVRLEFLANIHIFW